jgi:uncharacterized delta-60 repeat protein
MNIRSLIMLSAAVTAAAFIPAASASEGSLDATFDGDGLVVTDLGATEGGAALAVQADGKIVVAGHSSTDFDADFAVARYDTSGSLDLSFDGDGWLLTDFGGLDMAHAVAVQADGRIVVAGISIVSSVGEFALARYNADGTLDTGFGLGGTVRTAVGGYAGAGGVAIQPDGKIVVVGTGRLGSNTSFAVVRYHADGSLDISFGAGGIALTDFGGSAEATSVAIQADGKIVVGGQGGGASGVGGFALARYNVDGSLDVGFGVGGEVVTDLGGFDVVSGIAIQADGKIVAAGVGTRAGTWDFTLVRYTPSGALDASFDADGVVVTDVGSDDFAQGVAIQADGKIVAAGVSGAELDGNFAVTRYSANGSLDTSFDGDGKLVTDVGGDDGARSVAIQGDGKIIAAGHAYTRFTPGRITTGDFALARYLGTPLTPAQQVDELGSVVTGLALGAGTKTSLLAKLRNISAALSRGNVHAACGQLRAFVEQVQAELSAADAAPLVAAAEQIRNALGCR